MHASGQSHDAEEVLERELGRPLVEGGEDGAHGVGLGLVAAREAGAAASLVERAVAGVEETVALLVAAAHGELAELVGGVEELGGLGGDLLLVRAWGRAS